MSHPTVAVARKELETSGDVAKLATSTDTLGRQQPRAKPPKVEVVRSWTFRIVKRRRARPRRVRGVLWLFRGRDSEPNLIPLSAAGPRNFPQHDSTGGCQTTDLEARGEGGKCGAW